MLLPILIITALVTYILVDNITKAQWIHTLFILFYFLSMIIALCILVTQNEMEENIKKLESEKNAKYIPTKIQMDGKTLYMQKE